MKRDYRIVKTMQLPVKSSFKEFLMSDFQSQLQLQMTEVQGRFDALEAKRSGLVGKRAELDREISATVEEQIRVQGEYRALENLKKLGETPLPGETPN